MLTDTDKMTFWKYAGKRMQDVPYDYLFWLEAQEWADKYADVLEYIERNRKCLEWEEDRKERRRT